MSDDKVQNRIAGVQPGARVACPRLRLLAVIRLRHGLGQEARGKTADTQPPAMVCRRTLPLAFARYHERVRLRAAHVERRLRTSSMRYPFPVVAWYCPKAALSLKNRRRARLGGIPFPPKKTSSDETRARHIRRQCARCPSTAEGLVESSAGAAGRVAQVWRSPCALSSWNPTEASVPAATCNSSELRGGG